MANIKFTNFARSTLAVGINNSATTIALAAGTGARFPALVSGEYFYLTLENASLAREIVKVTARTVDSLTVVRAQDNTAAASWSAGDVAALRWNAATITDILANVSASGVATPEYATAIEGQTLFMLTLYEYRAGTGNLGVYVNGLFMRKDVDYTETSNTSVTFTSGLTAGDEVCFLIGKFVTDAVDSAAVVYEPAGTGAVSTTVQTKLRESVSVTDQGADLAGLLNSTAAFARARAITNRYYIPPGNYILDASPDPFLDCFTSGNGVTLTVGGVPYDCSNAFAGPLRFVAASAQKTNIVHAKTGNIIQYWQDGSPGTATGFYRGLAFTTDSHWAQAQPATVGGSVDMLMQRSVGHADSGGNRFNATFEESVDRWNYSYATTASGAPNFDSFMQVVAGTSPSLTFPALPLMMNQGWKLQTRAGGALKLSYEPTSATVATLKDDTSGNVLQTTARSYQRIAGVYHNTLLDVPDYKQSPSVWGGSFGDLLPDAFPVNKTLFTLTGATRYTVIGTMRVACVASGGGAGQWRETRFTHDGTTLTLTDVVNTITNFTATIAMSGSNIQFQGSYGGGLGAGYTVSVSVEWVHVGR